MVFLAKRLGVKNAENFWAGLGALIDKRDRGALPEAETSYTSGIYKTGNILY